MNSNLSYSPETPNLGQIRRFLQLCDLEIWRMTLKNNRAPLLSNIKLYASFRHHMLIQTGVTVRKRLSWVVTSVTLTLTFCMDLTSVIGNNSWKFHDDTMTVVRSSYLHNDISYTGNMTSLYWIRAMATERASSAWPHVINSHGTDLFIPEYSVFGTRRVNKFGPEQNVWQCADHSFKYQQVSVKTPPIPLVSKTLQCKEPGHQ